jgi:hypothetical protein
LVVRAHNRGPYTASTTMLFINEVLRGIALCVNRRGI